MSSLDIETVAPSSSARTRAEAVIACRTVPGVSGAAFFDLDRTLLAGASGEAFSAAMKAAGFTSRSLPGERLVYGLFNRIGETLPSMALARQGARLAKGRSRDALVAAGEAAADGLAAMVQPFAGPIFAQHRAAGRPVVLATTTPYDLVKPLADRLGLDDVVATRYGVNADGTYDGTLVGPFVWAAGKLEAVRTWAGRQRRRPPRELRLLRQLLRHAAARAPSAPRSSSTPTRGWS